jgi:hypothetical protein
MYIPKRFSYSATLLWDCRLQIILTTK